MRATWPRERLEAAIAVIGKSTSLDAACVKLRMGRHKLRRVFNAAGLANPSEYLAGKHPPEYLPEPQVREPEPNPRRIQPPPSWEPRQPKPSPLKKPLKNEAPKRYVIASDVHCPFADPVCVDIVAEFLADTKPDGLIIAGDFLDFYELSRFNSGSVRDLAGKRVVDTFSDGNRVLDLWQRAAGDQCRDNHYIDGNHEDRVGAWLSRGDNGVWEGDESVDIAARLGLRRRGFKYHHTGDNPDSVCGVRLGKVIITHGDLCGQFHAKAMVLKHGHSVVYGHTHVPQLHAISSWDGPRAGIGLGHLADPTAEALRYRKGIKQWIQGFMVLYVWPDGIFTFQHLHIVDGRMAFGQRVYGRGASTAKSGVVTANRGAA